MRRIDQIPEPGSIAYPLVTATVVYVHQKPVSLQTRPSTTREIFGHFSKANPDSSEAYLHLPSKSQLIHTIIAYLGTPYRQAMGKPLGRTVCTHMHLGACVRLPRRTKLLNNRDPVTANVSARRSKARSKLAL